MKKIFSLLAVVVLSIISVFADTIPAEKKDAFIVLSGFAFGEGKTVDDLFGSPNEFCNSTIHSSDSDIQIYSKLMENGVPILELDVNITFSSNDLCYISELYYELPDIGYNSIITCNNPTYEPQKYGQILGLLKTLLPKFYDIH